MHKLISELTRLYLPPGALAPDRLERQLLGHESTPVSLVDAHGSTRALVIPFKAILERADDTHWSLLCEVANGLQAELGFPAPAVSVSGSDGYRLWLSFTVPMAAAQANALLALLRKRYFPEMAPNADAAGAPVDVPPCLDRRTEKWAAFIHPGLGASFASEAGLEMAPPLAGQLALLEPLHGIGEVQLRQAMVILAGPADDTAREEAPAAAVAAAPEGLLLKDASLEDIVRHLHAKNIEPTFRHRLPN